VHTRKILFVAGDVAAQQEAVRQFQSHGLQVSSAFSLEEGGSIWRLKGPEFILVIFDESVDHKHDRMDSLSLIRGIALSHHGVKMPRLGLTSDTANRQKMFVAGCTHVCEKTDFIATALGILHLAGL
jgi:hypothetical protein